MSSYRYPIWLQPFSHVKKFSFTIETAILTNENQFKTLYTPQNSHYSIMIGLWKWNPVFQSVRTFPHSIMSEWWDESHHLIMIQCISQSERYHQKMKAFLHAGVKDCTCSTHAQQLLVKLCVGLIFDRRGYAHFEQKLFWQPESLSEVCPT